MASSGDPHDSEIEIRHINRLARISFYLPPRLAWLIVAALIAVDLCFAAAYVVSTLPDIRALTVTHRLAFLDMSLEGNLPTTWAAVKLYGGGLMCLLMTFSFERGSPRPILWPLAIGVFVLLAIDETAQLHEVWATGLAPKLFGDATSGLVYAAIWHLAILGPLYLSALTQMPRHAPGAFVLLACSTAAFVLSQLPGVWSVEAVQPLFGIIMSPIISIFGPQTAGVVWAETLELIGTSLLIGSLIVLISARQRQNVRYVYHPPA